MGLNNNVDLTTKDLAILGGVSIPLTSDELDKFGYQKLKDILDNLKEIFESDGIKNEDVIVHINYIFSSVNDILENQNKEKGTKLKKKELQDILVRNPNKAQDIHSTFILDTITYLENLYKAKKDDIIKDTIKNLIFFKDLVIDPLQEKIDLKIPETLKIKIKQYKQKMGEQPEANRDSYLLSLISEFIKEINEHCFQKGKPYISDFQIFIEKGGKKNIKNALNQFYSFRDIETQNLLLKEIKELIQIYNQVSKTGRNFMRVDNITGTSKSYFLLSNTVFIIQKDERNKTDIVGNLEEKYYLLIKLSDAIPNGDDDDTKFKNLRLATLMIKTLTDLVKYYIKSFKSSKVEYIKKPPKTTLELALKSKEPGALKALEYLEKYKENIENKDEWTKDSLLNDFFNESLLELTFSIFPNLKQAISVDKIEDILTNKLFEKSIAFNDLLIFKYTKQEKSDKFDGYIKYYHFGENENKKEKCDEIEKNSYKYIQGHIDELFTENREKMSAYRLKNIDILIDNGKQKINFKNKGEYFISYIGKGYFILLLRKHKLGEYINIDDCLNQNNTLSIVNCFSYFVSEIFRERGVS